MPLFTPPGLNLAAAAKTASFTADPFTLHPVDLSAAGADFVCTPPTAAHGMRFGWFISAAHASCTYGCEPLSTASIRGSTSHDNSYSLFQKSECIQFVYDGLTSTWILEHDGRIPFACYVTMSGDTTGETATAQTAIGFDTESYDNGAFFASNKATVKRRNRYRLSMQLHSVAAVADQNYYAASVGDALPATVTYFDDQRYQSSASIMRMTSNADTEVLAVGTVLQPNFRSQEGSRGVDASTTLGRKSFYSVTEIL